MRFQSVLCAVQEYFSLKTFQGKETCIRVNLTKIVLNFIYTFRLPKRGKNLKVRFLKKEKRFQAL